jgi:hypothetical protein
MWSAIQGDLPGDQPIPPRKATFRGEFVHLSDLQGVMQESISTGYSQGV